MRKLPTLPFYRVHAHSVEDSEAAACILKECLQPGDVVCFVGDLGAGKTTMIKCLCSSFGVLPDEVTSPTFSLLHEYRGKLPLYHFDLWRLEDSEEFFSLGFDEYTPSVQGITFIEWPEKISSSLPIDPYYVVIDHLGEKERMISLYKEGKDVSV
jgi:tRNA threonylcarbamoyladenosine biosynthesis protein TsaE